MGRNHANTNVLKIGTNPRISYLTYPVVKKYTQKEYPGLILVFLDRFWTFSYSICVQNYRTSREDV